MLLEYKACVENQLRGFWDHRSSPLPVPGNVDRPLYVPKAGVSVVAMEARVAGFVAPWVDTKKTKVLQEGQTKEGKENHCTEFQSTYVIAIMHLSKMVHKDINTDQLKKINVCF